MKTSERHVMHAPPPSGDTSYARAKTSDEECMSYDTSDPEDEATAVTSTAVDYTLQLCRRREADDGAECVKEWARYADEEEPNFFEDLSLAKDGGFSEVQQLWSRMRYLSAALTIGFTLSNLYFIIFVDVRILAGVPPTDDEQDQEVTKTMFLLTAPVSNLLFQSDGIHGDDMIAYLELFGMTWIIAEALYQLCKAYGAKNDRLRWFALEKFFWHSIPELASYSAMRLLHHIAPTVLRTACLELMNELTMEFKNKQYGKMVERILIFVVFHIFCLVVGFDSFLVKIREAYSSINQQEMTCRDLYGAVVFMMQVLGVIRLATFVQSRLFMFIFAGEDGRMDPTERARQEVWSALLVRKMRKEFPYLPQFLALMLSFGDTDFQKLVLNETTNKQRRKDRGL